MMDSAEIRSRFLKFFEKRGHAILKSAPLVTSDEKGITNSTLFNIAGVQPLIPYLLGQDHPAGKRLASSQKCIRTTDIDDVGDNAHLTFFEMLGNWSLRDYFKAEAIEWSFTFLTDKVEGLGLDPKRLYVTIFEGNNDAPKDDEALAIWKKFIPERRVFTKGVESNWWPAIKGPNKDTWTGPTGPCTEMFYDIKGDLGDLTPEEFKQAEENQSLIEIWNDVFMQFDKTDGQITGRLKEPSVDTGAGLERITVAINNKKSVYEIDSFSEILEFVKKHSKSYTELSARIIADHLKAATMLAAEKVVPSNTDRGYVLRRLTRRAVQHADRIGLAGDFIGKIAKIIVQLYQKTYPKLVLEEIVNILQDEEARFRKTLKEGMKEFEKTSEKGNISGPEAFKLFSTFGFPIEITLELAKERGLKVDFESYKKELAAHQEISRKGAEQKFKGGLAGTSEKEIRYHTLTHLLHQALRDTLGETVQQKGSNINEERVRFDFSYPQKLSDEQKKNIEEIVNKKIQEALPVNLVILPKKEAEKTGALHFFGEKYGDEVKIYFIGDNIKSAYSKEFCGGPHVKNTSELGKFKIQKEESVAAGIRRIKGVLI
ncbi:MAG TPA: alanine--tRNA ligase [Candidatus Paceibacterota bacterium]|nr:alanine--tRNA ligase [Candidatus Paceibacterota bacterium]HRZ34536.1 alanine--tRNA ligase [Candidatus Paceibacterota bacterium]